MQNEHGIDFSNIEYMTKRYNIEYKSNSTKSAYHFITNNAIIYSQIGEYICYGNPEEEKRYCLPIANIIKLELAKDDIERN